MNGFKVSYKQVLKGMFHLLLSGCFAVGAIYFFRDAGYNFSAVCLLLTIICFAFGVDEIREYYGE